MATAKKQTPKTDTVESADTVTQATPEVTAEAPREVNPADAQSVFELLLARVKNK